MSNLVAYKKKTSAIICKETQLYHIMRRDRDKTGQIDHDIREILVILDKIR